MVEALVLVSLFSIGLALFAWIRGNAKNKQLRERYAAIISVEDERERLTKECDAIKVRLKSEEVRLQKEIERVDREQATLDQQIGSKRSSWEAAYKTAMQELESLNRELEATQEKGELQEFGFYEKHFDFEDSPRYKQEIDRIVSDQESMLQNDTAASCSTTWTVGNSKVEGDRMTKRQLKLMLRAFNGEADGAIARVKYSNAKTMEARLLRSFEAINKLGKSAQCEISEAYYQLKMAELRLTFEYQEKIQAEKEEQREIRERLREEEQALKEIERAQRDAEKDEAKYGAALAKAKAELQTMSDANAEKLTHKVAELESLLAAAHAQKEKALSMAQQTKSGHVYIISNIGSFGENTYKIGMTRRLEPMDRVRELGDASVPFLFDVHAMIFTEDAPALETKLHGHFNSRRMNRVNNRKEFFRVSLDEIEVAVRDGFAMDVIFHRTAAAPEYRQTLALHAAEANSQIEPQTSQTVESVKSAFDRIREELSV